MRIFENKLSKTLRNWVVIIRWDVITDAGIKVAVVLFWITAAIVGLTVAVAFILGFITYVLPPILVIGALFYLIYAIFVLVISAPFALVEPPLLNWSAAMFRKRRTKNGKQATEARRDSFEVTAS